MLRHGGYISLCLNIRLVGVTIHYCIVQCANRIVNGECKFVMADSDRRYSEDRNFSNRNSHDPLPPEAAGTSPLQPESPCQPLNSGQGDLSLLKKKPTSFQITSVTVQGSRLSTDGGDDSADDLDESHTEDLSSDVLDISRTTDIDNDPLSEENSNNASNDALRPIPAKSARESQPPMIEALKTEPCVPSQSSVNMQTTTPATTTATTTVVISNTKPAEPTNESVTKAPTIPDQWQHRFKVVKIVSSQPFKRGRWLCMDFMDPPSVHSSEVKPEAPTESITNVTIGSNVHTETAMCGTQTTNNVAHVYEIAPNESYPGSISVTVCPQPTQQPFYGIFLPLNNSQMPDMSAMPHGFAQDPNLKVESNVPSMQQITVGFVNQGAQLTQLAQMQQQSYIGNSSKSYEENVMQSQSFAASQQQAPPPQVTQSQNFTSQQQPPQGVQSQSFATQPLQQPPQVVQSQSFATQPQQQPSQTGQSQSFATQSQQQPSQAMQSQSFATQSQQQPSQVGQSQNFASQPPQQSQVVQSQSFAQQPPQGVQSQSFASQQQPPQVVQSQSFPNQPQQQSAQAVQTQSFATQSQQQPPQVVQSQSFPSQPQQQPPPAVQSQSFPSQQQQSQVVQSQSFPSQSQQQPPQVALASQSQQQPPQVTQSQSFASQPQQQPPQAAQMQNFVQQQLTMPSASTQPIHTQSTSNIGSQTTTFTDTPTMQASQPQGLSVVPPSGISTQQVPTDHMSSMHQPVVAAPTPVYSSQNFSHASMTPVAASASIAQSGPTILPSSAVGTASVSNTTLPNIPPSIPENIVASSTVQQTTSKEVHSIPSQLPYNHVDAGDHTASAVQPVTEVAPEAPTPKAPVAEEAESAPSGSNTVAIDNKIEQAMDLVKSHLMFAVREEVDVLKEKITELVERISLLEYENTFLKANASQETLSQLNQSQQLQQQQQQQQQQQTQNIATAQAQLQQNVQNQQPSL